MNEYQTLLIEKLLCKSPNLIPNVVRSMNAKPYDDYVDIAYFGLCKAAINYKPEHKVKFSTYAVTVMKNEIKKEFESNNTYNLNNVSYESLTEDLADDFILLNYCEFEDEKVLEILVEGIQDRVGDEKFTILQMLIEGYTQTEIADACGCSPQRISLIHREIKNIFKKSKISPCKKSSRKI